MAAYNQGAYNPGQQAASMTIPAPVSSSFCVPYVGNFVVDNKVLALTRGRFFIRDPRGTLLFEVNHKSPLALHTRRVLQDASGNVLVLLKQKMTTMHARWDVYRGEDDRDKNLLFTMSTSSMFQFKPSFNIFLAGNKSAQPDFTVKGNFFEHDYSIFYHDAPVAQVSKKINLSSILIGKDQYGVTVYPGVDHAFIASVTVIMDQVKSKDYLSHFDQI